jgi:signal transduction histidine kinase
MAAKAQTGTIQRKLIRLVIFPLLGSTFLFCIVGGIVGVLAGQKRFAVIKAHIESALIGKGMTLIANNSIALRGLADDNAHSEIREIVITTVRQDNDAVYGIYMDDDRKPWVELRKAGGGEKESARHEILDDSVSRWASRLDKPNYRNVSADASGFPVIEFAAPVFGNEGKRLGFIRFGLSTAHMRQDVMEEQKATKRDSLVLGGVFFAIAAIIFAIGLQVARRQSRAIATPIVTLTGSANAIAKGNYDLTVATDANDEIGILADNFERMRLTVKEYTETLEKKVADRTRELEAAQKELVEKAHKAGMADIAVGTLHNIGNLLNSVRASIDVIDGVIRLHPLGDFAKANGLLRENIDRAEEFIARDKRGVTLLRYYLKLEQPLVDAFDLIDGNIVRLAEKVSTIADVIAAQQRYAGVGGLSEKVRLVDLIEDALSIQGEAYKQYGIEVDRDYHEVPDLTVQKTKLVHVLVNLIKNAKDAMAEMPAPTRRLRLSVYKEDSAIIVKTADTGCGISPENITKIFAQGFTTKKGGHGFGLHSCANYMKEMGGEMWAESDGAGKGARFFLKFPGSDARAAE